MAKRKQERDLTKFWKRAHVTTANVNLTTMTATIDGVSRSIKTAQNLGDGNYLVGYVDEHREITNTDSPGYIEERNEEGHR